MKLKELLLVTESRIFPNNFVRINIVEAEFKRIFGDGEAPKIKFDDSGMYVILDTFAKRMFDAAETDEKFTLSDAGLIDEIKNTNKFYIEFIKAEDTEDQTETPAGSETEETPPAA